jgi:type III pantothenate kinase
VILAVDAGNSRIKWGTHNGTWLSLGTAANTEVFSLRDAWQNLPAPDCIVIANVAGEKIGSALQQLIHDFHARVHWVSARDFQCGVRNSYTMPSQLGADRWAAAIAAWHLCHEACVVVNAGTAVTVDALSAEGVFLGGLIIPGISLMHESLAKNTTALKLERGQFKLFPANTADAIESGVVQALCGAIESMRSALRAGKAPQCLLSGGNAKDLQPHLNPPAKVLDNLVLEGLVIIAGEGAAK